jgi:hypothetical protein
MTSGGEGRGRVDRRLIELMELIELIKVNPVTREVVGRVDELTS